jgi:hypothetical protein
MDMQPMGGSAAAGGSGLGVAGAEEARRREDQKEDDDDCLVVLPMVVGATRLGGETRGSLNLEGVCGVARECCSSGSVFGEEVVKLGK